jgi:hypothetical protein
MFCGGTKKEWLLGENYNILTDLQNSEGFS